MKKKYEELTFTDDFMFCKVLQNNENLCKELVELILDTKIQIVKSIERQKAIEITPDRKGVRLDVCMEGDDRIFNIEMQNEKRRELSKRSRYYQGLIDLDQMEKGAKYTELKDTVIIFICPFDPLNGGLTKYTVRPAIEETSEIEYNDGTTKIFLSTESNTEDGISKELKEFLEYIAGRQSDSGLARRLEEAVLKARNMESWRNEYMFIDEIRDEGYEEGLKEGLKEGAEEGRQSLLFKLVASGDLSFEIAVKESGLSAEDFKKQMAEAGYEVPM